MLEQENRLIEIIPAVPQNGDEKVENQYDYQSRRIRKTVSQWNGSTWAISKDLKYIYQGFNLIGVYDAANSDQLQKTYTWGLDLSGSTQGAGGVGGLLSCEEKQGVHVGVYSFTFDANGNVGQVVNSLGVNVANYEYNPFGGVITQGGTYAAENPFQFSTKYLDSETNLSYYGYRYYSPNLGRWINRDPIEEGGGINLYAFVENNGINLLDYLGLKECCPKKLVKVRVEYNKCITEVNLVPPRGDMGTFLSG